MDMAARDLGIDPVNFRRKNLITEAELPYSIGQLVPYETETQYDSGDYVAAFERCLEEFGYEEKKALAASACSGRYHGVAAVPFVESGGAGPRENARMTLEPDGMVTIGVGSSALGQGLETVFAQIAGDALSLPFDRFRILHGSTTLVEEGFGTYHSRAVVMGGSAILETAKKLKQAIREAAAIQFGCGAEAVILADGRATASDGRSLSFGEIAAKAGSAIAVEATFSNTKRTYSYGAHAAHVAIDDRTGRVEVLDYVAVEDVGRAINPAIVHGQALGALVQGLGGVFLDHLIYDEDAPIAERVSGGLSRADRDRLPQCTRRDSRVAALAKQSARREGRRRGRHRRRCGHHRKRDCQCAVAAGGGAEGTAADTASVVAAYPGSAPKMTIDIHAHYVPAELIAQNPLQQSSWCLRVDGAQTPALTFEYGFTVRPFFPKLVEDVGQRIAWLDGEKIDYQLVATWPDIYGYGLIRR